MKRLVPLGSVLVGAMVLGCLHPLQAQDIEVAKDYYVHNVKERALPSFIEVFHDSKSPDVKAEALFYMGQISFEDNNYSAAFGDWNKLLKDFPTSKRSAEIKGRLDQMSEIMGKVSNASLASTVAGSYIRNGDFWTKGAATIFTIDDSYLPDVELAGAWYDRTISEFPGSEAAEIAYQRKLYSILGWKEPGQYGQAYGVKADFKRYMPLLLTTYGNFEAAFPKSPYLQGFRYQIAQAYWGHALLAGAKGDGEDSQNARDWLNKIITAGDGKTTFYTETAKARLANGGR